MKKKECLVYNLYFVPGISSYLPNVYVTEIDEKGRLHYMKAKAVVENIHTFDFETRGSIHESLFEWCEALSPDLLEKKFAKKGKKRFTLNQLYEDDSVKHLMSQYISRYMEKILQVLCREKLPLCLEIERKVFLEDIRIFYADECLHPVLSFKKTQTGIHYALELRESNQRVQCKNHDIHLILDNPGFVVKDYTLYRLTKINSNKLKPFLKKDSIFIPEHLSITYFKKFIRPLVGKADLDAEGFDIIIHKEIQTVRTVVTKDFISEDWLLDLEFDYGKTTFLLSEKTSRRSSIEIDDNGTITLFQIERSGEEGGYHDVFDALGLMKTPSKKYTLSDQNEDPYGLIHWLGKNRNRLNQSGIEVVMPLVENKSIVLGVPSINLDISAKNDWFDIQGMIVMGDRQIAFVDLVENIKQTDPFYRLADGNYFLIPESWMNKYSALAKFGKSDKNKLRIRKSNYKLVEDVEEMAPVVEYDVVQIKDITFTPSPYLKATLRPYQKEGVKWLLKHQINTMGACLADDMGLGKTLQTLAILNYTKDSLKSSQAESSSRGQLSLFGEQRKKELNPLNALILLPASLLFNWYAEIKKFSPRFHTVQYIGPKRKEFASELDKFDIVLTTYQTALRDIAILRNIEWSYVVLDESQVIKNKESKIFQAVNTLETKHKVSLSGTPIENSLADLWSQMQFINPGMLGSFSFFKEHYLIPIEKHGDETALEELKTLVYPFILRRRKEEVAADLPPLSYQTEYIYMDKEQKRIYDLEKSAARNQLLSIDEKDPGYKIKVFQSLMYLRQIANHPVLADGQYSGSSGKYEDVLDRLSTIIKSGHKALVFSSFTSHLDLYKKHFDENEMNYAWLTGSSTQMQRKENVLRFQNESTCQVFFISIKAGGTGLNLTKADYVLILDPWWNPFVEEQAIARAHRIGQDHPVSVLKFISKDSIEEKIIRLQAKKKILSAEIIEKPDQLTLTRQDLADLLQ